MTATNRIINKMYRLDVGESTSATLNQSELNFILGLMHIDFMNFKLEINPYPYVNPYTELNQFFVIATKQGQKNG